VDSSKPTQSQVCYDQPRESRSQVGGAALGLLPTLNPSRVYTEDGTSLKGRSRTSLFLLATPIIRELGAASEETMEGLLEAGAQQEKAATEAAVAKKLIGAQYFWEKLSTCFAVSSKRRGTT